MKIIQPSFQILEQGPGFDGVCKQIELAGRTCYKSEDKITDTSAKAFVERMSKSNHGAMLEHGTLYFKVPTKGRYKTEVDFYRCNAHSRVQTDPLGAYWYITTNYRVWDSVPYYQEIDHYMCDKEQYHAERVTVLFHTQIAITREFNRHRVNSMAESSTRYCNYSKDKFGNEIVINKPDWITPESLEEHRMTLQRMCSMIAKREDEISFADIDYWLFANMACEYSYMKLIGMGWQPQQARTVLPLDTNSDLVHTAFVDEWKHFFALRAQGVTGAPHPDASALAIPLYNEFVKRHLI
jgi:thymidylate synthase (FAD)